MERVINHSDGSVTFSAKNTEERWFPWTHPNGGFRIEGADSDPLTAELQPVFLWQISREIIDGPAHPGFRSIPELNAVYLTIPEKVRTAVYWCNCYRYELIQLAQLNTPGFLKLFNASPTLTLLLAKETARSPLFDWASLLPERQKKICESLGIQPGSWRILRKTWTTNYHSLSLAQTVAGNSRLVQLLSHYHYDNIPACVLQLCVTHRDVVIRSPSLLRIALEPSALDIAEAVRTSPPSAILNALTEILDVRERLGRPAWPHGNDIRSLAQLHAIRNRTMGELADIYGMDLSTRIYPLPPVDPDAEYRWISCLEELQEISERYENCLAEYHGRCLAGLMAVYERRGSEPYAVALEIQGRDLEGAPIWKVTGAEEPLHQTVDGDTMREIKEKFELNTTHNHEKK